VRWVDRAASNGALHTNTAARKKAQAARLVAGASS
jgi:ribosomal protein S20